MNFLSIQFAFFLGAAFAAFHLCPPRYRHVVLLVASYAFYFLSSQFVIVGIIGATVFTFFLAQALERKPSRDGGGKNFAPRMVIMGLAVAALVCYLAFFKAIATLRPLLTDTATTFHWLATFVSGNPLLPLGISYYTFRLISYVVDVYWEKIPAERNFIYFATYVSFFPQILAGPIQRSGDFLEQIRSPRVTPAIMTEGLRRMLIGVVKKAVIADNLGYLVGLAYPSIQPLAPSSSLLAFYLFPVQLYADFSALTDIAIGCSLLFGIRSPENFDSPFSGTSISQYWRRWHMSLTNWLKDYVFIPLRMATRQAGNWGLAFSLMVNMILIGLWHNLSWTFFIFGVMHGVFLIVDAFTSRARAAFFKSHSQWDQAANWIGPVFTFHLVALSSVFVRAESLPQAFDVLSRLFLFGPHFFEPLHSRDAVVGLCGLAAWILCELVRRRGWLVSLATAPVWARWALYYTVIAIVIKYGHSAEGFIYFKF
ncbi:MAG: MBOAT family O-acyltransferase [Bryobacteraceae bacterium]